MQHTGIATLDQLINLLTRLPGIGRKTAQRLAMFVLKSDPDYAQQLAQAVLNVKSEIHFCKRCFNIAEDDLCSICADPKRDVSKICVVEDIVDIMAIEEAHVYHGLYHVLGGAISPLAGTMPEDLHIRELIERVKSEAVKEILMALNPSTEGEATMIYISRLLKDSGVTLTRLASGVPFGSHLEYLDSATIGRAIDSRREL